MILDNEIISTIHQMRIQRSRKKDSCFLKIKEKFNPLICSLFHNVKSRFSFEDYEEIKFIIDRTFWKILVEKNRDDQYKIDLTRHQKFVMSYIRKKMRRLINKNYILRELSQDSEIRNVQNIKEHYYMGLTKFKKKFHRLPDFNEEEDRRLFSLQVNIKHSSLNKFLEIALVKKEDVLDNCSDDKSTDQELIVAESSLILLSEIKKILTPIQQKVIELYYFEQTGKKHEVAQRLKMSIGRFKGILDTAKIKLKNKSHLLKELYTR